MEIRFASDQITAAVLGTDIRVDLPRVGPDAQADVLALRQATILLHRELARIRPFEFTTAKLFSRFDYDLIFERGARSALPVRELADLLHVHLRLRRLTIDGGDLTIPIWRRNLDLGLSSLLTFLLPWAMVVAAWWWMPAPIQSSAALFLTYLLAVMYATVFVGAGFWLVLSRRLVPAGYRRALAQTRRIGAGGLFVRFWLRFLG